MLSFTGTDFHSSGVAGVLWLCIDTHYVRILNFTLIERCFPSSVRRRICSCCLRAHCVGVWDILHHTQIHPKLCCCDIITCMLHVCNAIDRISCYFDFTAEIIAERSFWVILGVQIRFLHAPNYMIWHHDHPNWTRRHIFGELNYFLAEHVGHLEKNGRHLEFLRGTHTILKE